MKNTARILSVLLVVFTLVSLIGSFGVSAETKVPNYDKAAFGELLYTADLTGSDGIFKINEETLTSGHGWTIIDNTIDATDHSKISLAKTKDANQAYGGDIASLPFASSAIYKYTVTFSATRTADTPVGIFLDGTNGGYFYATKARTQRNGSKIIDHKNYPSNVPGTSPSAEAPATQEYAIEYDNSNLTISLFVKDNDSKWAFICSSGIKDDYFNVTSGRDDVCGIYVYAYHKTTAVASNIQIYKGLIASETYPEITPKTGDSFIFVVGAAIVSVGGMAVAIKVRKKED